VGGGKGGRPQGEGGRSGSQGVADRCRSPPPGLGEPRRGKGHGGGLHCRRGVRERRALGAKMVEAHRIRRPR
jgi:hypothetical protein